MIGDTMKHADARKSAAPYFLVSRKHTKASDPLITFWRSGRCGYCWRIDWAGRYSEAEARLITENNTSKDTFAVLYSYAERLAKPVDPKLVDDGKEAVLNVHMKALRAVREKW